MSSKLLRQSKIVARISLRYTEHELRVGLEAVHHFGEQRHAATAATTTTTTAKEWKSGHRVPA